MFYANEKNRVIQKTPEGKINLVKSISSQLDYDIDSELTAILAKDKTTQENLEPKSLANYYGFLIIHHI